MNNPADDVEEDNDGDEEGLSEQDDDDDDDDDNDDSVCHPHHPHHQIAYFNDLDGYVSDDLDMSDDAGAPLVSYLNVASLLTHDMDLDASADFGAEFDFHDTGPVPASAIVTGPNAMIPATDFLLGNQNPHPHPIAMAGLAAMFLHIQPPLPPPQALNPSAVTTQLEQLAVEADDENTPGWLEGTHPVGLTNPNPNMLGPANYGLKDFLGHWADQSRTVPGLPRERGRYPWQSRIDVLSSAPLMHVQYTDLEGDQCDIQGVDWEGIGVTRREARERRLLTYNNYTNFTGTDRWTPNLPDIALPRSDSYFRFRRMDIRRNVHLSHFQLRNLLATSSRTRAFYPSIGGVHQFNPVSGEGRLIMKSANTPVSPISTLAAEHGVLVAGRFDGEYILRHLDSDEPEAAVCHEGIITRNQSGITNHVQVHQARGSSAPLAAFASNDMEFRVMDIATETWLSREKFNFSLNCTALSPDKRLRVMVGDSHNVLITAAEPTLPGSRPEILQELSGHRDFGFACDWADDGWTVATGFQDKAIKIWDARYWTDSSGYPTPVCTLRAEMAGVRGLRFSPVGSGKRVLVAAEEADFINIIDAQTFRSKQTVDIFGEIGGIQFTNDGQDLTVLCCDRHRGGLLQLERCGVGEETTWNMDTMSHRDYRWQRRGASLDWQPSYFTEGKRIKETLTRRRRRGADIDAMEPF
ncbi:WD40-repeat-containing domain protein [Lasiosphaeris hirsuta]|uniref:WD40-repeat-containing domain protein n=1 Tax=Lasiosphaeris hirsuta TaxID=260670 RepID=A0AA40BA67_9PEZI|nr:WD40-repeat-containing domain protein [Lasiosphaeris hirsuta]